MIYCRKFDSVSNIKTGGRLLEVTIIICLAIALYLSLKNFPKTKEVTGDEIKEMSKPGFWQKLFKRSSSLEDIKEAINYGQEKIIAPGEIDLAKKLYKESDPELARLLYEAKEALDNHDLREAENFSLQALKKDTRCGQAYIIMGRVAALRGASDDALESFRTAIKCNDELGEAYFRLGEIQLKEENFTEAILNLQKSVSLDRGVAEWHAVLGKAFLQIRQFAKAAKSLKRATSLDLENKEYRELASEAEDKMRSHARVAKMK